MFAAMNSYQFLYINAMDYLQKDIYDEKWIEREKQQNKDHFENITNLLTIDSFSKESLTTSN